jgi:sulfide dehydrogenase [flavocytochrome c] flavoprotein subunit
MAIVAALRGETMPEPSYVNTCYSLVGPNYGISIAAVYRIGDSGIMGVEGAGGVSPADADAAFRRDEARYAVGWYQSTTADIWS